MFLQRFAAIMNFVQLLPGQFNFWEIIFCDIWRILSDFKQCMFFSHYIEQYLLELT